MKTHSNKIYATKSAEKVPFKNELLDYETSWSLVYAVGNKKTYREFVRDCDNPDLLNEILRLKTSHAHFPSRRKLIRIAFYAAFAEIISRPFADKKTSRALSAGVYRYFMPKKQYA